MTRRGFLAANSTVLAVGVQPDHIDFTLTDQLRLPGFSWPVSKVSYPLEFTAAQSLPRDFRLVDRAASLPVPFQLTEVNLERGLVKRAVLNFLADLPSGANRTFRLTFDGKGDAAPAGVTVRRNPESVVLDNGLIRVELPAPGASGMAPAPILRFGGSKRWLARGVWSAADDSRQCRVEEVSTGPMIAEYRIVYRLRGGKRYGIGVRLTAQMEFVELDEQMEGFDSKDGVHWRLVWDGIDLTHRYTRTRPGKAIDNKGRGYGNFAWEPIAGVPITEDTDYHPLRADDQNLGPDGRLPIKIAPYHNWMSWWRLPTAAFWNEKEDISAGVFIAEMEKWDDRLYALWGSKDPLCVHFHLRDKRLEWRFPLASGTRAIALAVYPHAKDVARVEQINKPLFYIDDLRRWHGWLPLDKVRKWILDFEPATGEYPRFFETSARLTPQKAGNFERTIVTSGMIGAIPNETERGSGPNPVGSRTYHNDWIPRLDVSAPSLSPAELRRIQSAYAFLAYLHADETLMPMRKLLSGHPNFLADVKGVVGLTAFLLPQHPEAKNWADHYEKFLELNLRYHVRPNVRTWEARGGRWTENPGTYVWAAVVPMVRASYLLHHHFDGRNRILQPNVSLLAQWLLNCSTSPLAKVDGMRIYPPQGAHSRIVSPPYFFRVLGQELMRYDPLTAEHLLWATYKATPGFESEERSGPSPWRKALRGWETNRGTNPRLRSAKFTGYGFVFRAEFDTKKEIAVFLQQIDAGPNYRWGRAAKGGNGVIYYYAEGRSYSHNGLEDVGDGPFGDVERCTNFGVKKAGGYRCIGEYRAVGRNELTEPLCDFGFAQFAQVNANGEAAPEYIARSVLMSGAGYIVVKDLVRDQQVEGRFSWFTARDDEFPHIHQLKPGAAFVEANVRRVVTSYSRDAEVLPTKGRYYDGRGSFLTVVTHREGLSAKATGYGCEVRCEGRAESIFERDYSNGDFVFEGSSGILSNSGEGGRAALFQGKRIGMRGVTIEVTAGTAAVSIVAVAGGFEGLAYTQTGATLRFSGRDLPLRIDGVEHGGESKIGPGLHRWQWTTGGVVPAAARVLGTVNRSGGFTVTWEPAAGAVSYDVEISEDCGEHWRTLAKAVGATRYDAAGLKNGAKVHVRVAPNGKDRQAPASPDYPVYISADPPPPPEGLRIVRTPGIINISWGEVLGAGHYRLYRRAKGHGEFRLIVGGLLRKHMDDDVEVYEYRVTAANDNGESEPSVITDTDPARFVNWDPRPGERFRRDTESQENGYPEYSNWIEEQLPVLRYPD